MEEEDTLATIQFPPSSVFVSVLVDMRGLDSTFLQGERLADAKASSTNYLQFYGFDIHSLSAGFHYLGEKGNPHAHINIVCVPARGNSFIAMHGKNPSRDRNEWLKKNSQYNFQFCEFRYQEIKPGTFHADILSYPLKELHRYGDVMYDYSVMSSDLVKSLEIYANNRFKATQLERARKKKADEANKGARYEILIIAEIHRKKFNNYKEMVQILDEHYIANLEFAHYPRPSDYKVHCQQIAIKLGVAKYSDWC